MESQEPESPGYVRHQVREEVDALRTQRDDLLAALEEAMEWNWMEPGLPEWVIKQCEKAIAAAKSAK